MIYYAKSTGGFYDSAIHGSNIPPDSVEISKAEHTAMMAGQSDGKRIVPGVGGKPELVVIVPTLDEAKAQKIAELVKLRDADCVADVTVLGRTFPAKKGNDTAIQKLAARMRSGKGVKVQWILDVNDTLNAVNQTLLDAIEDAIANNVETAWNKYSLKVSAVKSATTVQEVANVTW